MNKQLIGMGGLLVIGLMLIYTQKTFAAEPVETGQVIVTYQVEEPASKSPAIEGKKEPTITPPIKKVEEKPVSESPTKIVSSQGAEPIKRLAAPISSKDGSHKETFIKSFPQLNERIRVMVRLIGGAILLFLGIVTAIKKKKEPKW
ncbi:hypothetical protein [Enterococcus sp. DIV1420a]|uniref:hypothetical protein n=1 Tax=Enterococcus sp. DIV1420a TaxID=2774672 RepID=UPI003F28730D